MCSHSPEGFESRHSPERDPGLRLERAPEDHVHPSDVNIRWYTDVREDRFIRPMETWLFHLLDYQLRFPCENCRMRQEIALTMVNVPVTEREIISGVSDYKLCQ